MQLIRIQSLRRENNLKAMNLPLCEISNKIIFHKLLNTILTENIKNFTYPVLTKFPIYMMNDSQSASSDLVQFLGKWLKPSTRGAPKMYGSSSPWTVPILCKRVINNKIIINQSILIKIYILVQEIQIALVYLYTCVSM